MELVAPVSLLPPSIGSIEAWSALDGTRPVTLVRLRPGANDIYAEALDADLRVIERSPRSDDELALLEVRRVEGFARALFAPLGGWVLRDLVRSARLERELAAAIALAIYRTYGSGPNVITRDGNLVRVTLPFFENVWDAETPSFIGDEPEISEEGRMGELWRFYAQLGGDPADVGERATLEAIEHPDPGPALVRALRLDER